MIQNIKSIRGMNDCLPVNIKLWQKIEEKLKKILKSYCFNEIRTPIIEHTSLFTRAIGNITDVVQKEMYNFSDRDGNSLTLRPENTASCVRAGIEHNLFYHHKQQRLWYLGPMFRYERPQKGRYRQFHQLGVEVFGSPGPHVDAELIIMTSRWWRELGIDKYISLEINSIGSFLERNHYRQILIDFLKNNINKLDDTSKKQFLINPFRILDSKNPNIQKLLHYAPLITEYLDNKSQMHFNQLCKSLDYIGIKYKINKYLVRGLDYYNNTVFEWITDKLNGKKTICAGGRYDHLVKQLGGPMIPAIGLAVGMERLILLMENYNNNYINKNICIDIYLISYNTINPNIILLLAENIRNKLPQIKLITDFNNDNLKKQLSRANKYKAKIAIIIGPKEYDSNQVTIKNLKTGDQKKISHYNIYTYIMEILNIKENM